MKFSVWQIVAFWAITVLGAQLPMYVLAASIDNDEHAKSALGWLIAAVFSAIAGSVIYSMVTGKVMIPGFTDRSKDE